MLRNPFNKTTYSDYVEESRRVAKAFEIPLCDANAIMNREIAGLSEEEAYKLLLKDNWHVNSFGHRIYADIIFDILIKNKYI